MCLVERMSPQFHIESLSFQSNLSSDTFGHLRTYCLQAWVNRLGKHDMTHRYRYRAGWPPAWDCWSLATLNMVRFDLTRNIVTTPAL